MVSASKYLIIPNIKRRGKSQIHFATGVRWVFSLCNILLMWLKWKHLDLNGCWNKLEISKLAEFQFWRTPFCQLSLKFNHSNIKLFFFTIWSLAVSKINRVTALKRNWLHFGRGMIEILMPKYAFFPKDKEKAAIHYLNHCRVGEKGVFVYMHISTCTQHPKPVWWIRFFNAICCLSKIRSSKNSNRKITLNVHMLHT